MIKFTVTGGEDIHQVVPDVFTDENQGDIGSTGYPAFKIFRPGLSDSTSPLEPTWNGGTYTGTCSYGSEFSGATIEIQEINTITGDAAPNTGNYRFNIRYKPLSAGDYGSCGANDDWIIVINGLDNPSENSIDVSVTAELINTASDGFDVKVWSKTDGSSKIYDVEIQVPTNTAKGGTDWINFDNDFLFYFDVIRIHPNGPGDPIAVQNTWPRDLPIDYQPQDILEDYTFPVQVWGKCFKTTTDECRGVSLEAWNDIGIYDGSADLSDLMSLTDENQFVARVTNTSEKVVEHPPDSGEHSAEPVPADEVRVTFRIAHWGVVGQDGDWREIPAGDNPTEFLEIPAGAGVSPEEKYEFYTHWTLSAEDVTHYTDHLHQCIKVELDSIADTNILKKGVARNMDFDPTASAFSRIARISTVGFGRPPVGEDKHSVILQVSTKQWEKSKDPVRGVKSGNQIAEMDSQLSYIVNGYIDTGRVIIINGKSCKIYAPMGSFVYVVHHDGEVNDWRHGIEGAEEVAMNTYKLEIEPESYKDIVTRIEPIEPNGLSLSLHVGPNIPLSNFANDYSTGFNVMADIGYEISRRLSVVAFFAYNFFPAMSSGMDDISIINVALNSAYRVLKNPSKALSLRVGPDLYIQDFKDIDFGYNAGFSCLHLLCRKLELEAGVDYHSHFNQDNWFLQSHVGIIFKF